MEKAVRDHPYPGVLPGTTPPLSAVYLRQHAVPRDGGGSGTPGDGPRLLSAERVLDARQSVCLVFGDPGGGKSSLLRRHVAQLVRRRGRAGARRAVPVPVLVPAAALVDGPLDRALARHALAELSAYGLLGDLPPSFFARAPAPGTQWAVLVDGVDEITDRAARQRVLRTVAALAAHGERPAHRFVLASRPLPAADLAVLGDAVPRYDLQPFAEDELGGFAEQWFRALDVPEPERVTAAFVDSLRSTGMAELARVPLMATMLCQLRAARPDEPLPASRGRLYASFVGLLHERQHSAGLTGIRPQTRAALERYGETAQARACEVLDDWPRLTGALAAARYEGDERPVLDLLAALPGTEPPPGTPERGWRDFLDASLCRGGLLARRADDYEFLHQTLLEYLAASAVPAEGVRLAAARGFETASVAQLSYFAFVLDRGDALPADAVEVLEGIAGSGLRGAGFVARLVSIGTRLPTAVVDRAARSLDAFVRDEDSPSEEREEAIRTLDDLTGLFGGPLGGELLEGIAGDRELDPAYRCLAAGRLLWAGTGRGEAHLVAMARDTSLGGEARVSAAQRLMGAPENRSVELLVELAHDTTLGHEPRQVAARTVAAGGDTRTADVLSAFAQDPDQGMEARHESASVLVSLGDPRGPALLESLARDASLTPLDRVAAVGTLLRCDGGAALARPLLTALVRDTTLGSGSREYLVATLAAVREDGPDEDTVLDVLDALARDTGLDPFVRTQAAAEMAYDGDSRGPAHLEGFARNPALPETVRAQAAYLLDGPGIRAP